jgi:mannose-6-phosphate isomerase
MENEEFAYPLRATGERAWRTYIGGKNIDSLCGKQRCEDSHFPELWILSTVQAKNAGREDVVEGLSSVIVDGEKRELRTVIAEHPAAMLGEAYSQRFGANMGVLVKVIDSRERLTIQVHPTKEKARKYFDSEYGKTECWHIVDTREGEEACIYMGFKEGVTENDFRSCFERQDLPAMLSMLHRIPVHKGETYLVRGGVPHAIGAGCTLIEIQEPTDYTLRVEQTTPGGFVIDRETCHLGIGVDAMMDCFSFDGKDLGQTLADCKIEPVDLGDGKTSLVGYGQTPCFRMERLVVTDRMELDGDRSFYGLYVLEGDGTLRDERKTEPAKPGDQFFVPAGCRPYVLEAGEKPLTLMRFWGQEV